MAKTWSFWYYGWFGAGDASDDVEYEAEVSDEEYAFLEALQDASVDKPALIKQNAKMIDALEERLQSEIEDADYENYDEEEDLPEIRVRWPWN